MQKLRNPRWSNSLQANGNLAISRNPASAAEHMGSKVGPLRLEPGVQAPPSFMGPLSRIDSN
jgi:hypothetical protein